VLLLLVAFLTFAFLIVVNFHGPAVVVMLLTPEAGRADQLVLLAAVAAIQDQAIPLARGIALPQPPPDALDVQALALRRPRHQDAAPGGVVKTLRRHLAVH